MSVLDEFHPITRACGLVQASAEQVCAAALNLLRVYHARALRFQAPGSPAIDPESTTFHQRTIATGLRDALGFLVPLSAGIVTRHLFLTATTHGWTAYFNNSRLAEGDTALVSLLAAETGARAVYAFRQEQTLKKAKAQGWSGFYGGFKFYVYRGSREIERGIECINDGGRWVFAHSGTPYPFEQSEQYQAPRVRDRFTRELLERYLAELGLRPYEESFYVVNGANPAHGVERVDSDPVLRARTMTYTLDQVRGHVP